MAQYDEVAADYARLIAPRYAPIARLVADRALPGATGAPLAVVEVAAGTGLLTSMLAPELPAGSHYVATDISLPMLALARRTVRGPWVGLCADAFGLPFADSSADLVVSSLGPVQEDVGALAEARRVLRPGGRLVLGIWGEEYAELDLLRAARTRLSLGEFPRGAVAAAVARCTQAGFDDVATHVTRLEVAHPCLDDYLAYRRSFGWPPWLPEERHGEWLPAVAAETEARLDGDGQVRLDWTVVVVEGRRPASAT
ncbi:SAM-dependent methyltransferase [Marmoricola sp. URHA0025 HA25]